MDFTQFDSRAGAENGAWLHLRSPATGELLWDNDMPCLAQVRGMESRVAIAGFTSSLRAKKPRGSIADIEENNNQKLREAEILIMGFDNVSRGARLLTTSADDLKWFLELGIPVGHPDGLDQQQRTFAEQIIEFARDRTNSLGNGLKPLSRPPAN